MMGHKTAFLKLNINDARRAPDADDIEPLTRFFEVSPIHADEFQSASITGKKIQKLPSQSPSYLGKENVKKAFLTPDIRHLLCHSDLSSPFTTIYRNNFKAI